LLVEAVGGGKTMEACGSTEMLWNKLGLSIPFSAAPNMNYSEEISLFANASDRFSADTIQRHAKKKRYYPDKVKGK
jgi:dihydroxyacid dehydratase/phosphogluconate dehydratase